MKCSQRIRLEDVAAGALSGAAVNTHRGRSPGSWGEEAQDERNEADPAEPWSSERLLIIIPPVCILFYH